MDTLGVFRRDELGEAGRLALMLAEPVRWLGVGGFGLSRPLGRRLDALLR